MLVNNSVKISVDGKGFKCFIGFLSHSKSFVDVLTYKGLWGMAKPDPFFVLRQLVDDMFISVSEEKML